VQAQSDFAVYRVHLKNAEECHRLHYLQMACEKIAKAYRLRDEQTFTESELYSHAVFSKFILGFLKTVWLRNRYGSRDAKRRHLERYARNLATAIEKLAPAIDRANTPANVEYPWIAGGRVYAPVSHRFGIAERLSEPAGRDFVALIELAITDYANAGN